jgi:glycosyltransferase involved in cell wall biosynthesis
MQDPGFTTLGNEKPVCIHLIESLANGGAENVLLNTVNELSEFRNIVVYLTGPNDLESKFLNAEVICLNAVTKAAYPLATLRLRKLITSKKAKIVHSHSYWTHILSRLSTPKDVGLVNTYHFADYASRSSVKGVKRMILLDKLTLRKKMSILSVSDYQRHALELTLGKEVKTIYNFIGDEYFKISQTVKWNPGQQLKLIGVGNIKAEKNYDLLIEACSQLKTENILVDIYGGGDKLELYQEKCRTLGLKNLRFLGPSSRIDSLLKEYHLYIMCSNSEAFPLSPIQAMSAGLPLLLSDIPALKEMARDKAVFFRSGDVNELVEQLKMILEVRISIDIPKGYYDALLNTYKKTVYLESIRKVYAK